jgi:hypothetical protein
MPSNHQDAEALDPRQTPGSCRNALCVHLVTSNGTSLPVKAAITHHPGSLSQGATWAVAFTRSSEAAAADERRLVLRVRMDGTIVGASRATPAALFGCDPGHLVGSKLGSLLDVFLEYEKSGGFLADEKGSSRANVRCFTHWSPLLTFHTHLCPSAPTPAGQPLEPALTALLMRSSSIPGSSWRVGVGKVEEAEAEAAARAAVAAAQGGARSMMRQASRQGPGKVKAAVMTVCVAGGQDEEAGGDSGGADSGEGGAEVQEDGASLVIQLWRADLISGVVELAPGCAIVRADTGAGRLLGVSSASLLQHHVYTCV